MSDEANIEKLKADLERVSAEWSAISGDRCKEPTPADWRRIDRQRDQIRQIIPSVRAWGDAVLDSMEVRYFVAKRRVLLAELGVEGAPGLDQITVKDQPERWMGVLLIVTFNDQLAAVDPKQRYDAIFTSGGSELYRIFVDPAKTVAAWLARCQAEGRPWVPRTQGAQLEWDAEIERRRSEYKRVKHLLYPTAEDRRVARERQPLKQWQVRDALDIVRAAEGEHRPPSIERQLARMNLDAMTSANAKAALRQLKHQVTRLEA